MTRIEIFIVWEMRLSAAIFLAAVVWSPWHMPWWTRLLFLAFAAAYLAGEHGYQRAHRTLGT